MEIISYPSVDLPNYRSLLWKEKVFTELLNNKDLIDMTKFNCMTNQAFIKRLVQPQSDNNGILIFHTMGSGKTDCVCIAYDNLCRNYKKAVFLVRGPSNIVAIRSNIASWLERYKGITGKESIREYIKQNFEFQKFLSFTKRIGGKNLDAFSKRYNNCIFIIDEAHDLRIDTNDKESYKKTYVELSLLFQKINNMILFLMTGTPMYDNHKELKALLSLLHTSSLPEDKIEEMSIDELSKNRVSYYDHSEDKPTAIYKTTHEGRRLYEEGLIDYELVVLPMVGEQLKTYQRYNTSVGSISDKIVLDKFTAENSFMRKLQAISLGITGDEEQTKCDVKTITDMLYKHKSSVERKESRSPYMFEDKYNRLFRERISTDKMKEYSIKFEYMAKRISKKKGTVYIYCELVGGLGIRFFASMFVLMGYEIVTKDTNYNKEKKRILILTADEISNSIDDTEKKIDEFNSEKNVNGRYIKIIIGSTISSQALTFKNVRQIHILTPHWNIKKIEQVETRAIRIKSHVMLPPENRQVEVYRYATICTPIDEIIDRGHIVKEDSADLHKYKISEFKEKEIVKQEEVLIDNSIDSHIMQKDLVLEEDPPTNGLYVNYYRGTLKEKFAKDLYDLFVSSASGDIGSEDGGLTLSDIVSGLFIDSDVAKVILCELTREDRFIHASEPHKLRHSDNYFYLVPSMEVEPKPISMFKKTERIELDNTDLCQEVYEDFRRCETDIQRLDKLTAIGKTNLVLLTRTAISMMDEEIMHFLRNLWVYHDGKFYERSKCFQSSNGNYNIGRIIDDNFLSDNIYCLDPVYHRWEKCEPRLKPEISNLLRTKIDEEYRSFIDRGCREVCFYSYHKGNGGKSLFIRSTETDHMVTVDKRKIKRGLNAISFSQTGDRNGDRSADEVFMEVLMNTVGLSRFDEYEKIVSNFNQVDKGEVFKVLSSYYTFSSEDHPDVSSRKILKALIKRYPHGTWLICKYLYKKNSSVTIKAKFINPIVTGTGAYYLR